MANLKIINRDFHSR